MANKLTDEDRKRIVDLYSGGMSYREITQLTGYNTTIIASCVRGMRSLSDSIKLARSKGIGMLTEEGRKVLSSNGAKACQRSGKYYTKPEQLFIELLDGIGVGVLFPDYIKEIKGVSDNVSGHCKTVRYQYPIQRYVADFVDVDNRVIINVNGDYWHANPILYPADKLGKLQRINVRQDRNKNAYFKKHDWTVLDVWESELYWNKGAVIDRLVSAGVCNHANQPYVQKSEEVDDWSARLVSLWFKEHKPKKVVVKSAECGFCGKTFDYRGSRTRTYCSASCAKAKSSAHIPSKEELVDLVSTLPFTKIGKLYNVSDKTIRNWCNKLGIELGSRVGYWSKARSKGPEL